MPVTDLVRTGIGGLDPILSDGIPRGKLAKEIVAKDEFLAMLSHELRTPLTAILGWARILKEGDTLESQTKAVEVIERNARLQIKLVDDLLDVSRIMKEKMPLEISICDLLDVLRSAVDTIGETAASKQIDLDFDGINQTWMVEADASRLQQVFVNILSNAVKFTDVGGHIRVAVERRANDVVVRITDTGKGIAPAFMPHAFEMFRQQEEGTRRQYAGLGIGLALVKRIIELHRGSVEIYSEGEGRGTQVTVRLPMAIQAHTARSARREDPRPLESLKILAVEDTEDALEMLRVMLRALGAHVVIARNGLEALTVLATSQPDLVLCDLRMPQMDGFEFLRELCRIQGANRPPVLALSGLTSDADHQRTRVAGFEGHIDKPFDDATLVAAVRSTLDHRRSA